MIDERGLEPLGVKWGISLSWNCCPIKQNDVCHHWLLLNPVFLPRLLASPLGDQTGLSTPWPASQPLTGLSESGKRGTVRELCPRPLGALLIHDGRQLGRDR